MLTRTSPFIIEIAIPRDDPRFQPFIRELRNSIPPETIQYDPDQKIYTVDIMSETTLYEIYRKHYSDPNQIGLFNESSM